MTPPFEALLMKVCVERDCMLAPVFKCLCQGVFICQKHCFIHIGGKCNGKLIPVVGNDIGGCGVDEGKFQVLKSSELLAALVPNDEVVLQCNNCGRILPKSHMESHACDRNTLKVFNIFFYRSCFNTYICSLCHAKVHCTFMYPHADLHLTPTSPFPSTSDINLLASLILKTSTPSQTHIKPPQPTRPKKPFQPDSQIPETLPQKRAHPPAPNEIPN